MNYETEFELSEKPWFVNIDFLGGVQLIYKFENGYGASVVRHNYSYGRDRGLWELAVIQFYGNEERWELTHNTPITDDVIRDLTKLEIDEILNDIKNLDTEEEQ